MLKTPLFIWIFIIIAVVATLHLSALQFYLYWRFWWFDILTHFLGGLWVSISFLWLFFQSGLLVPIKNSQNYNLAVAFLASLFIGIMWEAFEYHFGISFSGASNYAVDTMKDISFDLIGGLAAHRIFLLRGYHGA